MVQIVTVYPEHNRVKNPVSDVFAYLADEK